MGKGFDRRSSHEHIGIVLGQQHQLLNRTFDMIPPDEPADTRPRLR
jgi:hypothetical protein